MAPAHTRHLQEPAATLFGGPQRFNQLLSAARILIVDDEEVNVRLVTEMLRRSGFTAAIGLTDPRRLEDQFETIQPDLVLLDLHMPHRDGFSVLEALSPWIVAEHLPVCVVTGDMSIDVRRKALALGARDFITKPYDLTEVVLRVRNLLETRLLHRDLQKQNRALIEAVRGRTTELEGTRLEMFERLAIAAEYRDDATSQHTVRVGALSAQLAERLDIPSTEVALLRRASALHDVGKIGIPDALLQKPGTLTPDEMEIMRTHTTIGARILGGSHAPILTLAESIALTHHERWDGQGYPRRLRGEAIPIEGRIVAVADVFDALTNQRPYRRARSVPDALTEIERHSGFQFDPRVVDALLRVVPHAADTAVLSATAQ
jgi:putative two-component system response regulator